VRGESAKARRASSGKDRYHGRGIAEGCDSPYPIHKSYVPDSLMPSPWLCREQVRTTTYGVGVLLFLAEGGRCLSACGTLPSVWVSIAKALSTNRESTDFVQRGDEI
jgi:hypothetical protein